ncbi:MAG: trxA [Bacteroidota bacterium]|nr:trxA [Bacteroidota bacterium]
MALELTDSNFKSTVMDSNKLAIVDFWGAWCGTCKTIVGPIIDQLSKEYEGKVVIGKMDVGTNSVIPVDFGVRTLPTVLFIKNGQVVDRQVGSVSKSGLVSMLNKHIS